MRFLLIALTLSTASAALAQPIVLSVPNKTSLRVGMNSCGDSQIVTWTYNGTSIPCTDLRLWLVAGTSCGDEPSGTFKDLGTINKNDFPTQRTSTVTFKASELPGWTAEVTCGAAGREDEYRVCASYKQGTGALSACDSTTVQKDDFQVVYDSKPPEAPTIENVAALDKALSVRVSTPADASQLRLKIARADGTGTRTETQSVDQPLFRIENLENNVTYTLTATALDVADNESAASEPKEGTPIVTRGFFDRYVEAGGQETGGCGAAAGGLTGGGWVLAVLGFWLSSRRNQS